MQTASKNNRPRQLHRFKVGLVGANQLQKSALDRIFNVTQYRTRSYHIVALDPGRLSAKSEVDFVLMCSNSLTVINAWARQADNPTSSARPLILLSRPDSPVKAKYQLSSPVNPGRLIKLLDQYTIQELNFFPEFEIGRDTDGLDDAALRGLHILRSRRGKAPNGSAKPLRAMVVDDSLAVRKQMQIEFELLHDAVDLMSSAEAAMLSIGKRRYDIIFLDVVMPGMDGYAACKKIRRSVLNRDTPVIMLTSRSSSFDKIKGTLAGCSAYLVKPINHNEFDTVYRKYTNPLSKQKNQYGRNSQGDSNAHQQSFGG